MNLKVYLVLLLISLSMLPACNRTNPPPPGPTVFVTNPPIVSPVTTTTQTQAVYPVVTAVPVPGVSPTPMTQNVVRNIAAPTQLAKITLSAENLFINAKSNNFTKAQDDLNKIKGELTTLNPILRATPPVASSSIDNLNNTVSALEKDVGAKKIFESMAGANTLTRYTFDIADNYKTDVPTDFGRMKHFGREIELSLDKNDWNLAVQNYNFLKGTWEKVKTNFDATHKGDVQSFDNIITRLGKDINENKNPQAVRNQLRNLYDKVDVLTADYAKQKKS